jgi:hypothetical protein
VDDDYTPAFFSHQKESSPQNPSVTPSEVLPADTCKQSMKMNDFSGAGCGSLYLYKPSTQETETPSKPAKHEALSSNPIPPKKYIYIYICS